jgi:membrane protease subunit (stomatin/prohibitin family)
MTSIYIENISLPEEVEKVIDKRTSMGVIGNMQQYAQYQTAEAIRDAEQNPGGGLAGAGAGLGAGAAIGNLMGEAFRGMAQGSPQVSQVICPKCGGKSPADFKFCGTCGSTLLPPKKKCIKCGFELDEKAKFCPECGATQSLEVNCSKCGAKLPANSKFCAECGNRVE